MPTLTSLRRNTTSNDAVSAHCCSKSQLPSVEASSTTATRRGNSICAVMLSSCACRKRTPLYTHMATPTLGRPAAVISKLQSNKHALGNPLDHHHDPPPDPRRID